MKVLLTGSRADRLAERARGVAREIETAILRQEGEIDGSVEDVEVIYFGLDVTESPPAMKTLLPLLQAPTLRWLQSPGAGVDHPIWSTLLERGVRLTNASGIHAEPIAQYIFTYVLFWERQVARHLAQQAERRWEILRSDDLGRKTLGIVGYGGIGRAAGRIGRAFGMRVLGTRRWPVEDEVLDRFVPLEALHELLGESDYVVLCMPFSDETRGMIDAAALAAMRSSAVLINVARGGVVDEPALIEALRGGVIRGATLDVVVEEPLPADSPLWTLENCVITPHDAGYSPLGDVRLGDLFIGNLERFVQGAPLVNEIRSTGLS